MKLFELQDRPKQEKNFPRDIMPQIRKGNLQDSPFTFEKGNIKIKKLKPVQNQRVKGMHDRAKQGFADGSVRPIVIDKNNYIVNGHHRYDVARGLDYKKVKVLKVNATIEELIEYFSDTSSSEPTYEEFMKQKLDSLMETIEAAQDINALMKGIDADLKQRKKDLKKLPKKSIYSEGDVIHKNFGRDQSIEKQIKPGEPQEAWDAYDGDYLPFNFSNGMELNLMDDEYSMGEHSVWVLNDANGKEMQRSEKASDLISTLQDMTQTPLVTENFADGKVKGKSRPGRVKKAGASCKGSVTSLRKKAKNSSGEKAKMYHWCANMKAGRKKS